MQDFWFVTQSKVFTLGFLLPEARTVDSSFSASELLFFDDLAGQKTYQDHPIHQQFIADCAHLWTKVVVYDSVDIKIRIFIFIRFQW
jgi:hypothetical protein